MIGKNEKARKEGAYNQNDAIPTKMVRNGKL